MVHKQELLHSWSDIEEESFYDSDFDLNLDWAKLAVQVPGCFGGQMKILSWNVKGLGCPRKSSSIKDLLRKFKADTVMLQESKRSMID